MTFFRILNVSVLYQLRAMLDVLGINVQVRNSQVHDRLRRYFNLNTRGPLRTRSSPPELDIFLSAFT